MDERSDEQHANGLCDLIRRGTSKGHTRPSEDIYMVEARVIDGHLKEAVVHEGDGPVWRMISDEGRALKGTDTAPFPLGYFNAGLNANLHGCIADAARAHHVPPPRFETFVRNYYSLSGSFIRGDAEGRAAQSEVCIRFDPATDVELAQTLVAEAVMASPALAALGTPLANGFALTSNGHRRPLEGLPPCRLLKAVDPFMTWATPPQPLEGGGANLIRKTGVIEDGATAVAAKNADGAVIRTVAGRGVIGPEPGLCDTDVVLETPGSSHFALMADERPGSRSAPRGLALLSAGIAFCYLTQLLRFASARSLDIHGLRLVQRTPFVTGANQFGRTGAAHPVDTHIFFNGRADDAVHADLMHVAARTCFLHSALGTALAPKIRVEFAELG